MEVIQLLPEPGALKMLLKHGKRQPEVLLELVVLVDLDDEEVFVKGSCGRTCTG